MKILRRTCFKLLGAGLAGWLLLSTPAQAQYGYNPYSLQHAVNNAYGNAYGYRNHNYYRYGYRRPVLLRGHYGPVVRRQAMWELRGIHNELQDQNLLLRVR